MDQVSKDIQSVIKLVENCYGRITGLRDSTLTTIQREQATRRLQQTLADEGVTYIHSQDESGEKLTLVLKLLYVRDSGVITDVRPVGAYPVQLSVGANVSVAFEPRDISQVKDWYYGEIDNVRFANLRKGSPFEFSGRLIFCDYYPNKTRDSLSLKVDSEFRVPVLVAFTNWLRQEIWDGRPSGVDFKKR
jgi:hypothetical protein